jgi:uncharacterized membrane protein YdbT with pleckstrin-like domain
MSYVGKLLACNEQVVRTARPHWITLLPAILIDVAIGIVVVALSLLGVILSPPWTWLGLVLLILPLGHLLFRVWVWWNEQYVVTNRRLIQVTGKLSKRVSDTALEKINDVVMEQSTLGRLLDFGDVRVISGSESGVDVFQRVADPIGFKNEMFDRKAALADLEVFEERAGRVLCAEAPAAGDVPELIAELDELRQKGIITGVEFEEKKQQLLAKI